MWLGRVIQPVLVPRAGMAYATAAVVIVLFAAGGCGRRSETQQGVDAEDARGPTFVPPPAEAKSLVRDIAARRSSDGGVEIHGRMYLPQGTEIMIDLLPARGRRLLGQDKLSLGDSGSFCSASFRSGESPHKAGVYRVCLVSHFTKVWAQPAAVMELVGENGSRLPPHLLTPDDPEFPDEGGHVEITVPVEFPHLDPDFVAIEAVKNATLVVLEKGRSAAPIRTVVQTLGEDGARPIGWTARRVSDQKWTVSYICLDAGKPDTARWEYDVGSGSVRYINHLAKILSWLPAE